MVLYLPIWEYSMPVSGCGIYRKSTDKGISVVAPHPVTEGAFAVSQLCDSSRASGVPFFCAPGFSAAGNLGTWAENWWWCPVSFQIGYSDTFSAVWDTASSQGQEPGLLSYCEVLLLSVDLVSLYSSGSLGTGSVCDCCLLAEWVSSVWLCASRLVSLPCFSCFGYSGYARFVHSLSRRHKLVLRRLFVMV